MLWTIVLVLVLVLVVLWMLGFIVLHGSSFLIHLLPLLALIILIYNLVVGRRTRGNV